MWYVSNWFEIDVYGKFENNQGIYRDAILSILFFFPLKMIGAIATYILILIQFDVAMNQGPIHTGGNDTIENSTQVSIQ